MISFFGSSGAGKSTCYEYAEAYLESFGYKVFRANVARPLREVQSYAYKTFGKEYQDPDDPAFRQDGQLLGFLAKHFEERLGPCFKNSIEKILSENRSKKIAIINTDCRNNSYEYLLKMGFDFIRVETPPDTLTLRRRLRGDLTPFEHTSSVEQYDLIKPRLTISNDGTREELKEKIFVSLDILLNE